jgi:hypothetical protein
VRFSTTGRESSIGAEPELVNKQTVVQRITCEGTQPWDHLQHWRSRPYSWSHAAACRPRSWVSTSIFVYHATILSGAQCTNICFQSFSHLHGDLELNWKKNPIFISSVFNQSSVFNNSKSNALQCIEVLGLNSFIRAFSFVHIIK